MHRQHAKPHRRILVTQGASDLPVVGTCAPGEPPTTTRSPAAGGRLEVHGSRRRRGTLSQPVCRCSPTNSSWTASSPDPVTAAIGGLSDERPRSPIGRGAPTLNVPRGRSGSGPLDGRKKISHDRLRLAKNGPSRASSHRRGRSKGGNVLISLVIAGPWASPDRPYPSMPARCRLPLPVPTAARRQQRARAGQDQAPCHSQPHQAAPGHRRSSPRRPTARAGSSCHCG